MTVILYSIVFYVKMEGKSGNATLPVAGEPYALTASMFQLPSLTGSTMQMLNSPAFLASGLVRIIKIIKLPIPIL
jgi:hypothetical protein